MANDHLGDPPCRQGFNRAADRFCGAWVTGFFSDEFNGASGSKPDAAKWTFFGPKVDAFSTTDKIMSESNTCNAPGDTSAYWTPQLQKDGKPVPIKSMRTYYGSRVKDPSRTPSVASTPPSRAADLRHSP